MRLLSAKLAHFLCKVVVLNRKEEDNLALQEKIPDRYNVNEITTKELQTVAAWNKYLSPLQFLRY